VPAPLEPLAARLAEHLSHGSAYPLDASAGSGVRWVQTHISHVFLTATRVYKLRKAAQLGFVDFGTRRERNADCAREVRLNRRLAPDVYLGVAPVEDEGRGFHVGALREDVAPEALGEDRREHVVVMRRLPDGCDALSLLARGALRGSHLDAVAERLARFHSEHGLGVPSPFTREAWHEHVERPVRENLELLAPAAGRLVPRRTWRRACDSAFAFLADHADAFEARRLAGRAVEGHGDVHLQHVWFEPGRAEPLLVDCVEFREDLRRIDAAADVAFLAMDLAYRGRPRLAARFLRVYAAARDDFDLYRVVDYFVSYRASVRAKVAALAAADSGIEASQREAATRSAGRHLALAVRSLGRSSRGALVLLAGVVGTGKSTAAATLADAGEGVVIASDRVRKSLAGLAPEERGGARAGLYDDAAKDATYVALLGRAGPVLESGRIAILDATYSLERHRREARSWAEARGVPLWIVETRCAPSVARDRLARRAARDRDPSDAGPERYDPSAAEFEPLHPTEGVHRVVTTDRPGWRARVREIARELRARSRGPRPRTPERGPCRTAPSPP
jgi:aminoglycoside phosphotransferase family enzyme/predicted kinase